MHRSSPILSHEICLSTSRSTSRRGALTTPLSLSLVKTVRHSLPRNPPRQEPPLSWRGTGKLAGRTWLPSRLSLTRADTRTSFDRVPLSCRDESRTGAADNFCSNFHPPTGFSRTRVSVSLRRDSLCCSRCSLVFSRGTGRGENGKRAE